MREAHGSLVPLTMLVTLRGNGYKILIFTNHLGQSALFLRLME